MLGKSVYIAFPCSLSPSLPLTLSLFFSFLPPPRVCVIFRMSDRLWLVCSPGLQSTRQNDEWKQKTVWGDRFKLHSGLQGLYFCLQEKSTLISAVQMPTAIYLSAQDSREFYQNESVFFEWN